MAPVFPLNTDSQILDRIRKGDEEALVSLYQSSRKMILSYILKNHGSTDDAEDMLQEALVIVWERVRAGKYEPRAKISTYLYATVRHLWLRRLAKQRRELPTDLQEDIQHSDNPSPLEELIQSEEAERMAGALEKLGEPCKSLLLLYYWEEKSMEEIAASLGFANAQTAKSKKYQCKKALEKILKE